MPYDPAKHHRKSLRLRNYDYSQPGYYFVTLCIQHRVHLLGAIHNQKMIRNAAGDMVLRWWHQLPNKFPSVAIDAVIVMPNHFHGIVVIQESVSTPTVPPTPETAGVDPRVYPEAPTKQRISPGIHPLQPNDRRIENDRRVGNNHLCGGDLDDGGDRSVRNNHLCGGDLDDGGDRRVGNNHFCGGDLDDGGEHVGSPRRGLFQTNQCRNFENFNDRVSLGQIMQWFKTMTTNEYIRGVKNLDWQAFDKRFWQRNYYERILRSDRALETVRRYIIANPQNWQRDMHRH